MTLSDVTTPPPYPGAKIPTFGMVDRSYNTENGEYYLRGISMRASGRPGPKWYRGSGLEDAVPGKGMPMPVLALLLSLRMSGLKYGSLKGFFAEVANEETLAEMASLPFVAQTLKLGGIPDTGLFFKHFWSTKLGKIIFGSLQMSGHEIVEAQLENFSWQKADPPEYIENSEVRSLLTAAPPNTVIKDGKYRMPSFDIRLKLRSITDGTNNISTQ